MITKMIPKINAPKPNTITRGSAPKRNIIATARELIGVGVELKRENPGF
jgi:hypothetical protein